MNIFSQPSEQLVLELLASCSLPTSDLRAADFEWFLACGSKEKLDGVVGLQILASDVLLRSLAVRSGGRDKGCGRALVHSAEQLVLAQGINTIYLLTETAEPFFARLGYEAIERAAAPELIRRTKEFSELCPESATVMRKRLDGEPGSSPEGA